MLIKVKKGDSKEVIEQALNKAKERSKSNLQEFYGSLKRGIDPLRYQQEQRNE